MLLSSILFILFTPLIFALGIPPPPLVALSPQPRATTPYFPSTPESCPICESNWPSINSCADAAPVLANFTNVIFNPGAFIDVIKCACTDTFQSAFPQCVSCFRATNQTEVLDTPDLPSLVNSVRQVCAFAGTTLGNTTTSSSSSSATPTSTATSGTSRTRQSAAFTGPALGQGIIATAGMLAVCLML